MPNSKLPGGPQNRHHLNASSRRVSANFWMVVNTTPPVAPRRRPRRNASRFKDSGQPAAAEYRLPKFSTESANAAGSRDDRRPAKAPPRKGSDPAFPDPAFRRCPPPWVDGTQRRQDAKTRRKTRRTLPVRLRVRQAGFVLS